MGKLLNNKLLWGVAIVAVILAASWAYVSITGYAAKAKPVCNDLLDNDGDGLVDYPADDGCLTRSGTSEQRCGNLRCENPETYASCPKDCPAPTTTTAPTTMPTTVPTTLPTTTTVTNATTTTMIANSCSETDGGYMPTIRGTTSGYFGGSQYSNTDYCISTTYLMEFYCSGTRSYNTSVLCANSTSMCSIGACI